MSVEEVSNDFATIIEEVYTPDNLAPTERSQLLRRCMENIMERKGIPINTRLMEDAQIGQCARRVLKLNRCVNEHR